MTDIAAAAVAFLASFGLSTWIIRRGVPRLRTDSGPGEPLPESSSTRTFDLKSTGLWIGFFETLIVFVLVYQDQFGALAVIIGAKEFVRKEQIQKQPSYYLLGTLANLSVAMLFALAARSFARQ